MIVMSDNMTKQVATFDEEYTTDFFIFSHWYDSKKEYSAIEKKTIDFLSDSMNLISLAEMKDICDIAPCCELTTYKFRKDKKVISISYICVDMEQLFDVSVIYNAKGRAYALMKYVAFSKLSLKIAIFGDSYKKIGRVLPFDDKSKILSVIFWIEMKMPIRQDNWWN